MNCTDLAGRTFSDQFQILKQVHVSVGFSTSTQHRLQVAVGRSWKLVRLSRAQTEANPHLPTLTNTLQAATTTARGEVKLVDREGRREWGQWEAD